MKTLLPKNSRRWSVVFATLAASSALLVAAIFSNGVLRAVQEQETEVAQEETPPTDSRSGLRIPADISEEAIENFDMATAGTVSPLIATLFDTNEATDRRKQAATELKAAVNQMSAATDAGASLKSRLLRRVSLLDAGLSAASVQNISAAPESALSGVASAAAETASWLLNVRNGELWAEYLHLKDLTSPNPSSAILQQVLKNLTPAEGVTEEQKAFFNRPLLQALKAAIDAALAATAYEGDENAARSELNRQVDELVAALLNYESQRLTHDAESARNAYRTLKVRFPEAASLLRPEIMSYYFNHNLHFTVSEDLLSRMVSDYRSERGCIADCVMGAWVTGSQVTNVNVRADIRPSATTATFVISADGNTQSNTIARKDPATVRTLGNHFFNVTKPVQFDGRHVSGRRGSIWVDVNSQTVGVSTKYDRIPLFGGIIRNIARKEVAKSKGQSEAITAQKLTDEAFPKFEDEVTKQLAELDSSLQKTLSSLESKGVGPESISARSSNTHIAVSSRTMGVNRLGGSSQPPVVLSPRGMAVQLHETALNNTVDALGFNGRAIPEKEVMDELEKSLSDLLKREVKLKKDDAAAAPAEPATEGEPEPPTTFVFSQSDPIRAHFDDNQIVLVLRTAVLQEGREEIPEQVITIPISLSIAGGKLVLDPGTIGVNSKEESNRVKQITRANQIRRILGREIIRRELDTTFDVQAAGDRTLMLTLTQISTADGWLTAEIQ